MNLIDIPVPVIAALNGATTVHSEYALLANIVIATPETVFQDKPHFAFGIVPGDGVHLLWPDGRGRTFRAEEAKALGVTSEIAARDCIVHRARENRRAHCQTPSTNRQLYPLAVTQKLRPIVDESVAFGPLPGGLPREIALEELEDDRANLMDVGFEREMAGVVEVQLGIHVVALECLGAGR